MSLNVPVVLFIYKRSANLTNIVNAIREVKPEKIYIISDGPKKGEEDLCMDTRQVLENAIDWHCKVTTNYSKSNLGLKKRFSTGINWVFETEDRAIFVEDDCIPTSSFFRFCAELLDKYESDTRIATISGNNFLPKKIEIPDGYYFSRYPLIWGWATWKRAWKGYDPDLKNWEINGKNEWLGKYLGNYILTLYWHLIFNLVKKEVIRTWDYQLAYHCFSHQMLNVIPSVNLVTNVGVDDLATHTKRKSNRIGLDSNEICFPLIHPKSISRNDLADKYIEKSVFLTPIISISLLVKSLLSIISSKIKH